MSGVNLAVWRPLRPKWRAPPRSWSRGARRGCAPSAARMTASLSALPNTAPPLTSLTTSRSQPLRASLARARSSTEPVASPVSAAKPDDDLRRARVRWVLSSWRMSGFWVSSMVGRRAVVGLLDLGLARRRSGGSRRARRPSRRVGARRPPPAPRRAAAAVVSTRTTLTPAGSGSVDVGGDQGHLGAAGDGRAGQGVALQPARSGCRGSGPGRGTRGCRRPRRRPGGRPGPGPRCAAGPGRRGTTSKISAGSGSRPLPVSAPVSRPSAGSMTSAPALAQRGDVGLGGGVLPHLGVHRRARRRPGSGR